MPPADVGNARPQDLQGPDEEYLFEEVSYQTQNLMMTRSTLLKNCFQILNLIMKRKKKKIKEATEESDSNL